MAINPTLPGVPTPSREAINVYIGFDGREEVASTVAAHSIKRRSKAPLNIQFLKHRELRKARLFNRPWLIESDTGEFRDLIDNKPFTTEFSHTRFLIPALMNYKGWALFFDADMIFLSDIEKLFALCDDKYAVMCVKHNHQIKHDYVKMDDRKQHGYFRKNWSSFVLWNCGHPANKRITPEYVNGAKGADLHAFSWLSDPLIGSLPTSYNYIKGVSPALPLNMGGRPDVVHYTDGGPWFPNCTEVPYAQMWIDEYEHWQENTQGIITHVPSISYDRADKC
jgi:lipopolysaccharide biosynthesis glycosyltransferase